MIIVSIISSYKQILLFSICTVNCELTEDAEIKAFSWKIIVEPLLIDFIFLISLMRLMVLAHFASTPHDPQ